MSGLIALLTMMVGGPERARSDNAPGAATAGAGSTVSPHAIGPASGCRLTQPITATASSKSKLPYDVRAELETRLGGVAEVGEDYQTDDNIQTDPNIVGGRRPMFRFQSAVLIRREWFVTLERGTPTSLQTIGLEVMTDARTGVRLYHIQPMHNLIGRRCVAIEAMLEGVARP